MKSLTFKNWQVIPLATWLSQLFLHGKESRNRTRFIKLLSERIQEIEKERIGLMEKHQAKNKKGKPLWIDENGKDTEDRMKGKNYKIDQKEKFDKEFNDYFAEDFVLDVSPAKQETIYNVRDLVLNTEKEFAGNEALMYNSWCDSFEGIK